MKYLDVVLVQIKSYYSWMLTGHPPVTKSAIAYANNAVLSLQQTQHALETTSRQGALTIACEELEILADLLEAYFIEGVTNQLQKQAIHVARELAEKLIVAHSVRQVQLAIENDFEQLSKTMLALKNHQLKTDKGLLWSDIMRPSARTVALAIHRYQRCIQNEAQGFQDHLGRGHQQLNISYLALQRRVYLTELSG